MHNFKAAYIYSAVENFRLENYFHIVKFGQTLDGNTAV